MPLAAVIASTTFLISYFFYDSSFKRSFEGFFTIDPSTQIIISMVVGFITLGLSYFTYVLNRSKNSPSVFIIYSHNDKAFVDHFTELLNENGISATYDDQIIKIGDNIEKKINSAIESADNVIVVVSNSTAQSSWLKAELIAAIVQNKQLLPVLIDKTAKIPEEISGLKYADFSDNNDQDLKSLVDVLRPPLYAP